MKAKVTEVAQPKQFRSFQLSITIASIEEARYLAGVFNCNEVTMHSFLKEHAAYLAGLPNITNVDADPVYYEIKRVMKDLDLWPTQEEL